MFSRVLTMQLKPNHVADLTKTFEGKILPLLRQQEGFKDAIVFVTPGGMEATAISLWDRKDNAEAYSIKAHPEVLQALTNVLQGSPQSKSFDVISSTFHKVAAQVTV